jgi:hypothetical protein
MREAYDRAARVGNLFLTWVFEEILGVAKSPDR